MRTTRLNRAPADSHFRQKPRRRRESEKHWESPLVRTLELSGLHPIDLLNKGKWKEAFFLLDGSAGGWFDGQYSLFGGSPFARFRSKGGESHFTTLNKDKNQATSSSSSPLIHLQRWLDRFQPSGEADRPCSEIPFLDGGVVGFFSYDLVRQFEAIPLPAGEDPKLPDIDLLFLNLFVIFDHKQDHLHIIYNPAPEILLGETREKVFREAQKKIDSICEDITGPTRQDRLENFSFPQEGRTDCSPERYMEMVRKAKAYISAGDIFQANLSHRVSFQAPQTSLFEIYRRLWQINPSPFSAYLDMGNIQIASASPERLIRVRKSLQGDIVETRPIAGTRPRGLNPLQDERMIKALYGSEKERAEHLMLIDLERNDLGKICRYGSVSVDAMMTLEKYSHVLHLVSNITGTLLPGTTPLEALQALFPGGTITGVPKIRCMEIIAELEKCARGIYTGAIGYIGFGGEMDLNIAIRTWVRTDDQLSMQVGAGIVADSIPEREYQETLQKAAALIRALRPIG
ncbi:MAG: anthranilate synthase component I family protein [Nitrospiria bacterium]